jgi:hypothetical protein
MVMSSMAQKRATAKTSTIDRRLGVAYRPRQPVAGNREVIRYLNERRQRNFRMARDPIGALNVVRHNPPFLPNFLPFSLDPHVT